jgi:hypothetical protein
VLNKTKNAGQYILQRGWGSNLVFSHLGVEDEVIFYAECEGNNIPQENLIVTHRT